MCSTVEDELNTIDIGDKRLNCRAKKILTDFWTNPTYSIAAACKGKKEVEAAYRFFDNNIVSFEKIIQPHIQATLERIKQHSLVSLTQDTTEMWLHSFVEEAGNLNGHEHRRGFFLHPTIAFTLEGLCLGVVNTQHFIREDNAENETKHRNQKDIKEKESYRWLLSYRAACQVAISSPHTTIVSVADREGDIYEYLAEAVLSEEKVKAHLLVRAQHDRLCKDPNYPNSIERIRKKLLQAPILTELTIKTSKSISNKPREARIGVRAKTVLIKAPSNKVKKPDLEINIVYLNEIDPPSGEEPISWVLVTTLPINSLDEILTIIRLYANRFKIEVFFRTLKTGCKVEELRLEKLKRILPCLALYMIIAWRIMFLTMIGRHHSDLPCTNFFDESEWQTVYILVKKKKPPEKPPTINEIIMLIACLGGHIANSKKRPPGAEVIWRGLNIMRIASMTVQCYNNVEKKGVKSKNGRK